MFLRRRCHFKLELSVPPDHVMASPNFWSTGGASEASFATAFASALAAGLAKGSAGTGVSATGSAAADDSSHKADADPKDNAAESTPGQQNAAEAEVTPGQQLVEAESSSDDASAEPLPSRPVSPSNLPPSPPPPPPVPTGRRARDRAAGLPQRKRAGWQAKQAREDNKAARKSWSLSSRHGGGNDRDDWQWHDAKRRRY